MRLDERLSTMGEGRSILLTSLAGWILAAGVLAWLKLPIEDLSVIATYASTALVVHELGHR